MFDVFNKMNVKDAKLVEYRSSTGGDMIGGGRSTTVKVYDETYALVIFTSREHHAAKEEVKEYLTDINIIEEIEKVFRKYDMQRFVCYSTVKLPSRNDWRFGSLFLYFF